MRAALHIFCSLLLAGAVARGEATASDDTKAKQAVAATKTESVGGASETWAVESIERAHHLYPTNWGHAGTFRVRSAETLPTGTLTFGIGGEFYAVSNGLDFGTGSEARTISESLFLGFSPVKQLNLGVTRRNSSTTFGTPAQLISSLGDFNFSVLYSIPLSTVFALAPIGNVLVASNFNNLAPSGNTVSAGLGIAGTLSLFPMLSLPIFIHANVLYHLPQVRGSAPAAVAPEAYYNFSRFHTIQTSLAGEIKLGDFIPFIEFHQTVHADAPLAFGSNPIKMGIGSRFTPLSNKGFAVLLGADVAFSRGIVVGVPYSPNYQILGQLSYTVGLSQTERKHYYTTNDVGVVDRKFVINKNINFKVGKAELEPDSSVLLDEIADVVQKNRVQKLLIVGHTDSSSSEDFNLKLSVDRANTVKRYLHSKGIAEETLLAEGYGRRKPRASNATEEGRTLNRRVEFFILE